MYDWVHHRGGAARYAVPVAAVAVAAGGNWILQNRDPLEATPLYLIAVALATWFGGFRSGFVATGLSVLAMVAAAPTAAPSVRLATVHVVSAGSLLIVTLLVGSLDAARRRSAQMLSERDTRLRLVSEQIPAGLWSTDDQLRLTSRFGGAPALFVGPLGTGMTEFFRGDPAAAAAGDDFPPIAAHLRALRGQPSTFELESAGRMFQAHVEPLQNGDGEVIGVIGVALDITERKRGEQRLEEAKALAERARAEAEQATQAKDRFLAMLSHELRTPLTPALAATASLAARVELPEGVRDDLHLIRRNIQLEARLIDDLLDLTRVATGKLKLERRPVDAHAALRDAVEICRGDVREQHIELSLDLAAGRHHVHGDAARLQQVFWNLIKNAVKFTPPAGRIEVRTSNPDPADPDRLVVEVSDTGIGIEPDVLPRIFNAFEQGGTSTTRRFGGLGLGLAISRALVEAHQGKLTAASEGLGHGATFRVELHASAPAPAAEAPDEPAARSPEVRRPLRVLLVEDHADTRNVLARLLRAVGHSVTTADTAESALRVVANGEGDAVELLVSDLALPDGSGIDVVRAFRARRADRPLKAIALSGWGMEDDVRRSLDAGFDRHLTKPISLDALLEAVEQLGEATATV